MVITLEDFFSIPILFFKLCGLSPFHEKSVVKYYNWLSLFFWLGVINLCLVIIAEFAFLYLGIINDEKFLKMISCAACTAFGIMALDEMLMTWRSRSKILNIINFLRQEFPKTSQQQETLEVGQIYKETRIFMIIFGAMFAVLVSAFNFTPVILNTVNFYLGHSEWNSEYPFFTWFPFDASSSIGIYVGMYLLQMWGGFVAVLSCLGMNLFLGAIVTQLCLQFKMLKSDIKEAVDLHRRGHREIKPRLDLGVLVMKHDQLIKCCQETEDTFAVSILVNYIVSSLILCLVLFQVVVGDKLSDVFKFSLFLFSTVLQTLSMSRFGQDIIDHSTDIANTVYHSNWLETDVVTRRSLLLILIRSQRPLHISAYKTVIVPFSAFFNIVRNSYSYFTLLRTMYKNTT